jgi:hypothetical protein
MAAQLIQTKGADPATPSTSDVTTFPDITTGMMKSITDAGVKSILSPNARNNWLRNSGFWFAQSQAPGTATNSGSTTGRGITGATGSGADGWGITNENANTTFRRVDTQNAPESGLQSRFYGEFLKVTATGKIVVSQCLEGSDLNAIRGRTVRWQVRMRSTVGMTVRLGVVQLNSTGTIDTLPATYISAFGGASTDPTLGTALAYIAPKSGVTGDNCTANGNAFDCTLTTAWQRFGGCFDVPTNAKNLLVSVWSNAQIAAADGFRLAEAILVDGYEIQDFSPFGLEVEFDRTRRFIQRSFWPESITPAQNAGVGTGEGRGVAGKAGAVANAGFIPVVFGTPMRTIPAVTVYNPAAANALARNITGAADMGATSINNIRENGFYTNSTGVAATAVGDLIAIHWLANAEV